MNPPKHILPIIIGAQFLCTSLWFASNGVLTQIVSAYGLDALSSLSNLTAAVQLGFILGTLTFALLSITDRFSPSKVFFTCAVLGALCNLAILWPKNVLFTLALFRMMTGFFLAGIYPVGMKIAADYFEKGLGKSLSLLVGALVLGTAFPHALNAFSIGISYKMVIISTTLLAVLGGLALYLGVPDGPFRKKGNQFSLKEVIGIFKIKPLKTAALGYFGHMWELYTFWTFVPIMISAFKSNLPPQTTSILSFVIIAIGSVGCIIGGFLSQKYGPKKIATIALSFSFVCCLLFPITIQLPFNIFILFMCLWGMAVITDSPLFSTLVASAAPPAITGTALTLINCLGYTLTIVSIQVVSMAIISFSSPWVYSLLAIGPMVGLYVLFSSKLK
ncbi:MFS transporter [Croceivirga sp. JEA036]|nr:MFS transporter [Croceivirga sp. JEA036]